MKGLKIKDISVKAKQGRYGIVYTSWNPSIVQDLLKETKKELISQGVDETNIYLKEVPGAFELPLATLFMAEKEGILSVISLGAIIRGDTPHFDFISKSTTDAIMNISVESKKPVGNGIITCLNQDQAEARSKKGREAAEAVISVLSK